MDTITGAGNVRRIAEDGSGYGHGTRGLFKASG